MSISPLILGHRGASALVPENTLAAFSRAIDDGADGIEFDVRLSRDNVPVVIHDATLKRTGLIDRSVSDLNASELREVDVGSWFAQRNQNPNDAFTGEKLPTLSQVFEFFSTRDGLLYAELKCELNEGVALANEVIRLVREFGMADRVVVESFDHSAIAAAKRIDPGVRTAALFEPKLFRPLSTIRRLKMIDAALRVAADEIALHHTLAAGRVIDKAVRAGLEVVVWTVEDSIWITRARSYGIKALISNDPASMLRHRNVENASR